MGKPSLAEVAILFISVGATVFAIVVATNFPGTGANIFKEAVLFGSGGGITYALARWSGRIATGTHVQSLCRRTVQRLGLIVWDVRRTAGFLREYGVATRSSTPQDIATSLDSSAAQVEVTIGDLEEAAGVKLLLDQRVDAALQALEAVKEELPPGEARQKLSGITEQLAKGVASTSSGSHPESVSCPDCAHSEVVMLGDSPGSTAHVRCSNCHRRSVVHRGPLGEINSKPLLGKVEEVRDIVVGCPGCGMSIGISVKPDDPKIVVRNCFRCDLRIYVDTTEGTITTTEKRTPLSASYVVENKRAVLRCPICDHGINARLPARDGDLLKASCPQCTSLIHAALKRD